VLAPGNITCHPRNRSSTRVNSGLERDPIIDRVGEIEVPKTLDGARAMARVGLANIPRDLDGDYDVETNPEDWLFYGIAKFLTEGEVA
jgi:hypothetical protein